MIKCLPTRWGALRSADFAELDADRTVALWPLGATEQHGPHLPLNVDAVLADAMCEAALQHLEAGTPVLLLPTLAVGLSLEHRLYAGTLTLSVETVLRVLRETAESVLRAGVRKLLLFNAHGGHVAAMDLAARDLRTLGLTVFHTSYDQLPLGAALDAFDPDERRFGVHAGEVETSMMLALAPGQVRMDLAQHITSSAVARVQAHPLLGGGHSRMGWHVQDLHPGGAVGQASQADAARGQALLDSVGEQLAILLRQLVRFDPLK